MGEGPLGIFRADVYFSTLPGWRGQSAAEIWRGSLIRLLGGSRITHCNVGVGEAVCDFGYRGNRYHPQIAFRMRHPSLLGWFEIPCRYALNLDAFHVARPPLRTWPTLRRWLLRGHGPWTEDCLCCTLECLAAAGVHGIPDTTVSPAALYELLTLRGERWIDATAYRDQMASRWRIPD